MIAELKLIGPLSQRIWASAPPAALDAFEAANRRLRGRGGEKRGGKRNRETKRGTRAAEARRLLSSMASSVDSEGRFLAAVGAVPIPELLVAAPMLTAARNSASRAAVELRQTEPELRWFKTLRGGQLARGWFDPAISDVVWVSASLAVSEVGSVVRHESEHRDAYLSGRRITEGSARRFAARYAPSSDSRLYAPRQTDFFSSPLIGA